MPADPLLDLVDLTARRALTAWEQARAGYRLVQWVDDGVLIALDVGTAEVFDGADHVELADRIGLGVRA